MVSSAASAQVSALRLCRLGPAAARSFGAMPSPYASVLPKLYQSMGSESIDSVPSVHAGAAELAIDNVARRQRRPRHGVVPARCAIRGDAIGQGPGLFALRRRKAVPVMLDGRFVGRAFVVFLQAGV